MTHHDLETLYSVNHYHYSIINLIFNLNHEGCIQCLACRSFRRSRYGLARYSTRLRQSSIAVGADINHLSLTTMSVFCCLQLLQPTPHLLYDYCLLTSLVHSAPDVRGGVPWKTFCGGRFPPCWDSRRHVSKPLTDWCITL